MAEESHVGVGLETRKQVCRRPKQMPAIRTNTALSAVSEVVVLDALKLPTTPRMKISSSPPKIIPLVPVSDNMYGP